MFSCFTVKSPFYHGKITLFPGQGPACWWPVMARPLGHFQVRWTFAGSGPKELMYCFLASKQMASWDGFLIVWWDCFIGLMSERGVLICSMGFEGGFSGILKGFDRDMVVNNDKSSIIMIFNGISKLLYRWRGVGVIDSIEEVEFANFRFTDENLWYVWGQNGRPQIKAY